MLQKWKIHRIFQQKHLLVQIDFEFPCAFLDSITNHRRFLSNISFNHHTMLTFRLCGESFAVSIRIKAASSKIKDLLRIRLQLIQHKNLLIRTRRVSKPTCPHLHCFSYLLINRKVIFLENEVVKVSLF